MVGVWSGRRKDVAAALLLTAALTAALLAQGALAPSADARTGRRDHMVSLTNTDRAERGREALGLNAKLSRYAKKHSRDMAQAGYLFHTEDLTARLKGVDWSIGGENVGVGSDLDGLQDAFMRSKPHRRNILGSRFEHVAIGIVQTDDSFWVTVIFYG
ncbi:MAG TPA: CAP domain-containing protein [Actinomycetota bacterium]|jgi:uncharacterized protein YkwD|nr:CAP domain-containing protein [Actinomycetota bacterium]